MASRCKRSYEEKEKGELQVDKENEAAKKKRKPNKNKIERLRAGNNKFQAELENLDELDDSFDVYDRYITWTMVNYPQASGPQSKLYKL